MNEEQLLYDIDNACPNHKGLSMYERRFILNLWNARAKWKDHVPTEPQLEWLRKIHLRVVPKLT